MEEANSSRVVAHYNSVPNTPIKTRKDTRIYHLRCFNNWIKSELFKRAEMHLNRRNRTELVCLDLCCGKGGDLYKWNHLRATKVFFADIADVSLEQCKQRYSQQRWNRFTARFVRADVTKERLASMCEEPNIEFDVCSCQFSLHYGFESEGQARIMLRNAVERLKPGGIFFGTIPDAERIMYLLRKEEGKFVNDVVCLEYDDKVAFSKEDFLPPIFGAKYHFTLENQVNCPEYLVHFPVLQKLLEECGMELLYTKRFCDLAYDTTSHEHSHPFARKICAFETYPPPLNVFLKGNPCEYQHAESALSDPINKGQFRSVGTLSKSEWEVVTMYQMFIFKRR